MEIVQVINDLVCTRRLEGLGTASLRVVRNELGVLSVATDPVGAPAGKWVFVAVGTAARLAMAKPDTLTDLSICGIIDEWASAPASGASPTSV